MIAHSVRLLKSLQMSADEPLAAELQRGTMDILNPLTTIEASRE